MAAVMSILPRLTRFTAVEEKCPLLAVEADRLTTVTKTGVRARLIELDGVDTGGLESALIEAMFQGRKMLFDQLPRQVELLYQSHRVRLARDESEEGFSVPMAQAINQAWSDQFRSSFRTRHFLVLVTSKGDLGDQLATLFDRSEKGATAEEERVLHETAHALKEQLRQYHPRDIEGDDIASYWGWMLSGRHVQRRVGSYGLLDGILSDTHLSWPRGKRYQVYRAQRTRYSAWLIIKTPAATTDNGFLEALYRINRELSVFQSFGSVDKAAVMRDIADYRQNVVAWARAGDIILEELDELEQRVQANEITMVRHRFAVEVFGGSPEELEAAVSEVTNTIQSWSFPVAREKTNQEALFWSRFPAAHEWNPRVRTITSENAAHFAPFSTVGEGLDGCSWGDAPVMVFRTTAATEYSFTFQATRAKEALGHMLAIGGSEAGKTTIISMLLSQSLKFPHFRALCLDRLRGMEVFTRMHDGVYLDAVDGLQVNPLQLDDDPANRMFLAEWFQMLTKCSQEQAEATVRQAYTLPKGERTLPNVADAFGLRAEGSARSALERWLPGGSLGAFFSGERDALEFERPIVTLDMTTLLDSPEILAPMAAYLVQKMLITGRRPGGYAVFVDELPKYLKSSFAPIIEMMLQEIRKTDGVFIGAAQSADAILDYDRAPVFLNNVATYLLFPEPRAQREHYVDMLGLTEAEFEWVRRAQGRQILIKRRGGSSVVVDSDLSGLGRYLGVFQSGADAVRRLNELRRERPDDWKDAYLAGV